MSLGQTPEIRYVRSGGVHVAYTVFGEGPDLVGLPGWASNLDLQNDIPVFVRDGQRLARMARLIRFDKSGIGLSDPLPFEEILSIDRWIDDLLAVLDAVGAERPVLTAYGQGAQLAAAFAALHPSRVKALLITQGFARLSWAADYEIGIPPERQQRFLSALERTWGTGAALERLAPSLAGDERMRAHLARFERGAASPGLAVRMWQAVLATDVRHLLGSISAPTTVVHSAGNRFVDIAHGRALAEGIPDAHFVEVPGDDDWYWVHDDHPVYLWMERLLARSDTVAGDDRVLATVLFTDIADSTGTASLIGDKQWRMLLDEHDHAVRKLIELFRGREVKATGDGFLATFDGPGRAIRCALAVREETRRIGLTVRAALHMGEVEPRGDDVAGIAVHTAARLLGEAAPGEVLVSSTVKDVVAGLDVTFEDRGVRRLRGVRGEWSVYAVTAGGSADASSRSV